MNFQPAKHSFHKHFLLVISILLVITFSPSCNKKEWIITNYSSIKIALDSATEQFVDKKYETYLDSMKKEMGEEMNIIVGQSAQKMTIGKPESGLSNFIADIYREAASTYLSENIDLSIVNIGSIRTNLSAGNITTGNVFEILPFENELIILWIKGDKLNSLLHTVALFGGGGVSGISMGIKDRKAINVLIGGEPLNPNKTYTIATNDFLAEGNDRMVQLAGYEKRINTGLEIRKIFIEYIQQQAEEGKPISSQPDGRIYIQ